MNAVLCHKCEHPINKHTMDGCQHTDRPNSQDIVCDCYNSPDQIAAALRARVEAAEALAKKWQNKNKYAADVVICGEELAAALAPKPHFTPEHLAKQKRTG